MRVILGPILTEYYTQNSMGIMPFYRVLDLILDEEGEVTNFKLDTLVSDPNSTVYAFMPYIDVYAKDKRKLDVFNKLANNNIAFINYVLDLAYDKRSPTKAPFRTK